MDIVPQWSVTLACLAGDCSIGGHASVGSILSDAVCCLFVGWYRNVVRPYLLVTEEHPYR